MSLPNHPQHEGRRRFVQRALDHFYKDKTPKMSEDQLLRMKVESITIQLQRFLNPILKAGGGFDKKALFETIHTMYFEAFATKQLFSREELASVLAQLHTEIMLEVIEAAPTGSSTPDKISGAPLDLPPTTDNP